LIWADGGYSGELVEWVQRMCGWTLQIVKRSDDGVGFQVLPRRWVVERTFGWLNRWRRLSKDDEALPQTSQAHDLRYHVADHASPVGPIMTFPHTL